MSETFIGVRGVDEDVFRKFRARAVERRIKLGLAITQAMKRLLEEDNQKQNTSNLSKLLKIKPFSFGKGTEKISEEIDNILYGRKG
jgi:hypothetical protein